MVFRTYISALLLKYKKSVYVKHRRFERATCQIRTDDPEITSHVLWPAELRWRQLQLLYPVMEFSSRGLPEKLFKTLLSTDTQKTDKICCDFLHYKKRGVDSSPLFLYSCKKLGRFPSGQRGQTVNLLRKLRRFESFSPQ